MVLGFVVLVLAGLGITLHAQAHGIKFFYTERFNIAEYLEQERAERHAHNLKAEKIFLANELRIMKAENMRKKYQIRRATDSVILTVIINALFHSKEKMKRVRPHTARKLTAGRRKSDGKSGLLDFGLAISGIAFLILVLSTPLIPTTTPNYAEPKVVKVIEYKTPTTDTAKLQKELLQQSQAVLRKQDKAKAKRDQARYDADKGTVIELY